MPLVIMLLLTSVIRRRIIGVPGGGSATRGKAATSEQLSSTLQTMQKMSSTKYYYIHTHTHTHTFNGRFSRTTRVSRYQKGKTSLDLTEARDSEWQWHQLGHMQVCTSFQTDNHASTSPLSFLQAGWPSCRPTNSVKALKAIHT